jgi:hypothetical protein
MSQPLQPLLRIRQGATEPFDLAITMPSGDLDLASELTFELRRYPTDVAPLVALTLSGGAITVVDAELGAARLVIPHTITAQLPLGRLHFVVWLDLTTGEHYPIATGIALVDELGR